MSRGTSRWVIAEKCKRITFRKWKQPHQEFKLRSSCRSPTIEIITPWTLTWVIHIYLKIISRNWNLTILPNNIFKKKNPLCRMTTCCILTLDQSIRDFSEEDALVKISGSSNVVERKYVWVLWNDMCRCQHEIRAGWILVLSRSRERQWVAGHLVGAEGPLVEYLLAEMQKMC